MTYSDFLQTFLSPISSFLEWATTITNSLINNYVFITVVGLSVITSLLSFFVYHFLNLGSYKFSKKHNLDNGGKK